MCRAVACMDIGPRPEELCFSDDRKSCRSFKILIREENMDTRECFGVTRSWLFAVSALEVISCDILPGAALEECAETGLFGNALEPLMFGNNAKRWLSRND